MIESQTVNSPSPQADARSEALKVFLCYRRQDGAWHAKWLHKALDNVAFVDGSGRKRRVETYYDMAAPGVADWKKLHFPSLQTARALILVCTPGVAKDLSKPHSPDWVYEELRWWCANRSSPPIVVDATENGDRWLPDIVSAKWPDINRLPLRQEEANASPEQDAALVYQLRARILATLQESERATVFEDLENSKRLATKLKWVLATCFLLLVFAVVAVVFALRASVKAEEKAAEAQKQYERAERQAAIATAQAWDLHLQLTERSELSKRSATTTSSTSYTALLRLIYETLKNSDDVDGVLHAVKILQCFGPYKGTAMAAAFGELFARFAETSDDDLKKELGRLREVFEADQRGASRPKYPGLDRCAWVRVKLQRLQK
jgi:hypothetical protein